MATWGTLLLALFLVMPRRAPAWYWLLPGCAFGSVAFLGLHAFATYYLPNKIGSASETYGAIGTAVAILAYLFLIGQIIVASGIVNTVWYDYVQEHGDPIGWTHWMEERRLRRVARRSGTSGSDTHERPVH
jgi:uncharacterized BrkB/YihY/UPF0761 family membrane protein